MIVISFDKNVLLGGLGDRIVGLISCKVISKLLNKPFYISWTKENVKEYIDYREYDYELIKHTKHVSSIKYYSYIDNQLGLKHYLMNESNIFMDDVNIFYLNQEISQYLYKNTRFNNYNYYEDILNEYRNLYTTILKPTALLKNKIDSLITINENIIGIQIRTGDKNMVTNKGEQHSIFTNNIDNDILNILERIKIHCEYLYKEYKIFLTSDYNNIYNIALNVWESTNIIYNNDLIQHLDRNAVNRDISKVFVDSYILAQNTNALYISTWSNYGRIAALTANHDNIYDLFCIKLNKKHLVSKHEIIS